MPFPSLPSPPRRPPWCLSLRTCLSLVAIHKKPPFPFLPSTPPPLFPSELWPSSTPRPSLPSRQPTVRAAHRRLASARPEPGAADCRPSAWLCCRPSVLLLPQTLGSPCNPLPDLEAGGEEILAKHPTPVGLPVALVARGYEALAPRASVAFSAQPRGHCQNGKRRSAP